MNVVTVRVTKKDIQCGQKNIRNRLNKCRHCAITLAISRVMKLKPGRVVWFGIDGEIRKEVTQIREMVMGRLMSLSPDETDSFVGKHDALKKVKPFFFKMRITR